MPSQFFNTLVKLGIHLLLVTSVGEQNAAQLLLRELQLTNLLGHILAYVKDELVIAVLLELTGNQFLHTSTELFLSLYFATGEHLIEESLIEGTGYETCNLSNLEVELTLVVQSILLIYLQQRSHLSLVIVVCN